MFFSPPLLLLASLLTFFYFVSTNAFAAAQLPKTEVQGLRDIAKTLGKRDWNFSVDPCSVQYGWVTPNPVKGSENAVSCNCSFSNATVCHVTSMYNI
ncbi:Leucine-rich repeat Transmembrane protein kinase [Parasponia andersonii]|uniref:Leucine-rich repeat Transmembrane protein kinase n=1 Tax=Parasponia andersonii TaxID=3476 RepID=A0A2P5D988_PARAD|nr:Leucine-rich repeat Transmembrane protein kinase [Parasponia andersonii]